MEFFGRLLLSHRPKPLTTKALTEKSWFSFAAQTWQNACTCITSFNYEFDLSVGGSGANNSAGGGSGGDSYELVDFNSMAHFDEPEDYFDVEIHVDKSLGSLYKDCVKIAKNYTTSKMNSKGKSTPKIFKTNHGLRAAWFDAWYPKPDDEFSIFVEDDLELSPYWYIWLKKTWRHYGNRSDIAGIALQRQFNMFQKPAADVEINNEGMPFLYKLVATWGFSPHPKHWREFLDWFHSIDNEKFDPYVPGLITSDWLHIHTTMGKRHMTWEQWHIYYGERHGLYTLYHNLPRRRTTLASNWREAGVHTRNSFNTKDYPTLDYCAIELQEFPEKIDKIWVGMHGKKR
ncbi:unnamed protein product [Lepeophtheirus salmonis]|uniref:(salmon louse) hypothetical protein n=1 Tax=Lepeophtheirus salmonis TaxID=72036 RepID=A0A7R8HDU9_LEPSM|nr:unnamed protein product [Lepeophtheirus salmonis]CAF3029974.1 unnamed protein product [Lepeophtheirus salmonis]